MLPFRPSPRPSEAVDSFFQKGVSQKKFNSALKPPMSYAHTTGYCCVCTALTGTRIVGCLADDEH